MSDAVDAGILIATMWEEVVGTDCITKVQVKIAIRCLMALIQPNWWLTNAFKNWNGKASWSTRQSWNEALLDWHKKSACWCVDEERSVHFQCITSTLHCSSLVCLDGKYFKKCRKVCLKIFLEYPSSDENMLIDYSSILMDFTWNNNSLILVIKICLFDMYAIHGFTC